MNYKVRSILATVESRGIRTSGTGAVTAADRDAAVAALQALQGTKRGGRYNPATDEGQAWCDARVALWSALLWMARHALLTLPAEGYAAGPIREAAEGGHPHIIATTDQICETVGKQRDAAVGMAIARIGEAVGVRARAAKTDDGRWAVMVTDR